ncbi:hypothetical protein [Ferrimonas balearica]|uniref:hypothetical protein n=1 Tax=Ferrimonas balearica TaxID=44012 RepID=UPI001C99B3B4|nr:hypothetical protein [Ferrimonas balearica]MBY5991136.1 hypothetical protein [Ferrimonas balearica]
MHHANALFTASRKLAPIVMALSLLSAPLTVQAEEAEEAKEAKPAATNIFEQHGLSEDIPKLGLNSLSQSEHLVEQVTRRVVTEKGTEESQVFLVQTTDTKGNIDLRIKYDPALLDEHEDLVDRIEAMTLAQYRLKQFAENYDKSSAHAIERADGSLEIGFKYSKFGLPQDIAYFRHMRVKVIARDGAVESMTISNSEPFELDGYQVSSYRQTLTFKTLDNGRVLFKKKVIDAEATRKGKPVTLHMEVTPVAVYDDELGTVVMDEHLLEQVSDPRIREEHVQLHRVFPLMGDLVRRQGIDLPLPFGVSLAYRNQSMDVGFTDFDIMGVNLDRIIDPETTYGDVTAETLTIRGDVNILPFWNVFGYVGKLKVTADVDAQYTGVLEDVFKDQFGTIGGGMACNAVHGALGVDVCSPARFNVPVNLNYTLAGIGTTLSVGYKQFFASVTGTYSSTKMDGSDNWSDGIVTVQPMLGYQFADARAQVFVGAEYQDLDPRMTGQIENIQILGETFTYDVGVDVEKWAGLIGLNKQFGKNYNLTAMYILGETRESFTLNFGYRF